MSNVNTRDLEKCREILQSNDLEIEDQYILLQYCIEATQQTHPLVDIMTVLFASIGVLACIIHLAKVM